MRRRVSNALAIAAHELGTRPLARRWVAGTLLMLLAGICVSAWIDNDIDGVGSGFGISLGIPLEQLGVLCLAGFVAGCVVRRWQAVLLALLPILVAIPFGLLDPGSPDPYFYLNETPVVGYVAVMAPFCAASIAAGVVVGARRGARPGSRRGGAPAPPTPLP